MSAGLSTVLVANRGEIARRVFRSCRDLGLGTVAVHSDADAGAPHVRDADTALRLPGVTPAETYLRGDLIVAAALRAGADAVHPGYGFLSEHAGFARAVQDAGLVWIGPDPDVIAAMGSKIEAKHLMAAAGVPVLPQLDPDAVTAADLPVLIKASAGGGGRGMRVVHELAALPAQLEAARAEAASAFGDPTVFCEPYLPCGRHVEVQVVADRHGTVWTVGERECSVQRRHQKVIEEAPSPLVERVAGMRERLFAAADAAARAVGYTGAGTVEFLADEQGRFYFLEMNTRLQVEHPVTECTTGLDLVALQLDIATGGRLPDAPPPRAGHAIEVRLYAEDPRQDWQPQTGAVHRLQVPGVDTQFRSGTGPSGIRLDSGVTDGTAVGVHYDPMLAKVISWAPTRDQAARALARALARTAVHGVRTNRDLLVRVLRHGAFLAGDTDTAFFTTHGLDVLAAPLADRVAERISALAAALALDAEDRTRDPVQRGIPSGWRNVVSQPQCRDLEGAIRHHVTYRVERGRLHTDTGAELINASPEEVLLAIDGVRHAFAVHHVGGEVFVDSPLGPTQFGVPDRFPDPAEHAPPGSLLAPMPGAVARIGVRPGDRVTAGTPILWLEAMKMQHGIAAPVDGTVTGLPVREGEQVEVGTVLAVVTEEAALTEDPAVTPEGNAP